MAIGRKITNEQLASAIADYAKNNLSKGSISLDRETLQEVCGGSLKFHGSFLKQVEPALIEEGYYITSSDNWKDTVIVGVMPTPKDHSQKVAKNLRELLPEEEEEEKPKKSKSKSKDEGVSIEERIDQAKWKELRAINEEYSANVDVDEYQSDKDKDGAKEALKEAIKKQQSKGKSKSKKSKKDEVKLTKKKVRAMNMEQLEELVDERELDIDVDDYDDSEELASDIISELF